MISIENLQKDEIDKVIRLNVNEYWDDPRGWEKDTQYERWLSGGWWADKTLFQWYRNVINQCDGEILVAKTNNEIIGELDYVTSFDPQIGKKRLHIIWLLVDDEHRGKGVATKLLKELYNRSTLPIWVEPEDERSFKLYKKYGRPIRSLTNWSITSSGQNHNLQSMDSSIEHMIHQIKSGWLLVGNYYAPCFDLTQLKNSDTVEMYIWGDTPSKIVKHYSLNSTYVTALLTQYPRFTVSPNYSSNDLKSIIDQMTYDIAKMSFEIIYLQYYVDETLSAIFSKVGYKCDIKEDPVYQITQFS